MKTAQWASLAIGAAAVLGVLVVGWLTWRRAYEG